MARVGPYTITGATFNRFLSAELSSEPRSEQLIPPDFAACVAHLTTEAAAIGEHSPGPSQLGRECQTRYQTLLQKILDQLISNEWLIGGARELGVPISDREVRASLARSQRHYKLSSEARSRRSPAGRNLADIMLETRARLAFEAIRRAIKDRVRPITHAQIVSYYKQHRFEYLATAERDLTIARAETEASAAKVKAEIASGKSFASVVRTLRLQQPFNSHEGLVLELQPHVYGEPKLNRAIFAATPGALTGPIGTSYGYFVFDVVKIRFEHEKPLTEVQASIQRQLARPLQEQALAGFIKQWRAKWTAQTDCSPGDIVPECRQFKGLHRPEILGR